MNECTRIYLKYRNWVVTYSIWKTKEPGVSCRFKFEHGVGLNVQN